MDQPSPFVFNVENRGELQEATHVEVAVGAPKFLLDCFDGCNKLKTVVIPLG